MWCCEAGGADHGEGTKGRERTGIWAPWAVLLAPWAAQARAVLSGAAPAARAVVEALNQGLRALSGATAEVQAGFGHG